MNLKLESKWRIFAERTGKLIGMGAFLLAAAQPMTAAGKLSPAGQSTDATQQTIKITGHVSDTSGESLIGASIVEKGNSNGTITDVNGNFSFTVSSGATLVVSYLGYQPKEETLKVGKTHYEITLNEDLKTLDEVVVVGYGTVKKANLTGSVDQIKGEVLNGRPIVSVAQALQGTIANLNVSTGTSTGTNSGGAPGARMSFNIRGVTGLTSNSDYSAASPLFVVDGIQSQDINAVNPDDIESISVLKDAASAAIYGSNAPYGVVLITTKKGAKDAKPTVTYSANFGWSSPINVPTLMNSLDFAKTMNDAGQNTRKADFYTADEMKRIEDYFYGRINTSTVKTSGNAWASFDDMGHGRSNDNVNWFDVYLKDNSFTQQHNVGVSGGSNNSSYYVGAGYNQKGGILRYGDDSFNRYNVRANLSSNITDWFTVNVRGSFARGITDRPSQTGADNFMQNIAQRWPTIPLITPDGYYSEVSNIYAYKNGGRNKTVDDVTVITGEFVITPVKNWNTTFNYTFTDNNVNNQVNSLHYTLYDTEGTPYYMPNFSKYTQGKDALSRTQSDYEQYTINAFTSYELNVGDHYLKGLAGFAQEEFRNYRITSSTGNGTLYTTEVPTYQTIYGNTPSIGEPLKETLVTRGVFGRINYGYKEKYLLELNGRYDGTSRYLKDVRFKFYPGVSAAWIASGENFWGNDAVTSHIDMLKIRASYGSLGEQSGGYYPFYPSLSMASATASQNNWLFNGNRYAAVAYPTTDTYINGTPNIANPNLTWVTSTTIDFGLDIALLKNRLTATFDWYRRSSDDVVGPSEERPAVLGATAPRANNASLETNGWELTLVWRDRIGDIGYGVRGTLADSKTVVKKYPNLSNAIATWYDGAVIGDIWGYVTEGYYTQAEQDAGIDQDRQKSLGTNWTAGDIKYKNLDDDPLITRGDNTLDNPGDRKIIGNSSPRFTYGVTLDADWKGFDISAFFQGVGKRDYTIGTGSVGMFWGIPNSEWQASLFTIHNDRWTPETPDGYFPKYYLTNAQNAKNQQTQTKYLQDASYLRFKNLQIGYTFPKSLLDKAGINKLRVYVSGENLATLTDFVKTIDPEFLSNAGLIYPLQRTWSLGLNLSF
ncbi:MAG: SusC/RagA family TonB-linked outer membrane protein [Mediterranea sp.]|jgi:TonB-linked SusC/RagA family outer membrane protein|nr:SusC/RagA family TonB-linked outer membrane protein [Mediterranea sp.]